MASYLTRRELDIMSIVWELGSATVQDVKDKLSDDLAYPSVLTMMRTLEAKGHVRHEKDGKAFRYYPKTKSDAAGRGALSRVLSKMYQGSRELLVAGLLDDEDISAGELRRLKKLIADRLKEVDE